VINGKYPNLIIDWLVKDREGKLVQHCAAKFSVRDLIGVWSIGDSLKCFVDTLH
jgi:hypothetical protein